MEFFFIIISIKVINNTTKMIVGKFKIKGQI